MKCSAWSSLAISVCSALVFAHPADAHVTAAPPWVAAGDVQQITLTAPNERKQEMTGFSVTVPNDFRIVEARSSDGWRSEVRDSTATWAGRSLDAGSKASFSIDVEAPVEPGAAVLQAVQRYPAGALVRWGVELTVVPPSDAPSQNLGWALLAALIGLGAITAVGLALFRRSRSLQER